MGILKKEKHPSNKIKRMINMLVIDLYATVYTYQMCAHQFELGICTFQNELCIKPTEKKKNMMMKKTERNT